MRDPRPGLVPERKGELPPATARSGNSVTEGDAARARPADRQRAGGRRKPAIRQADRITVILVPQAGEDLRHLQDRTSLSKTDILNRAITLYEFIEAQMRAGRNILIRDGNAEVTQLVLIA